MTNVILGREVYIMTPSASWPSRVIDAPRLGHVRWHRMLTVGAAAVLRASVKSTFLHGLDHGRPVRIDGPATTRASATCFYHACIGLSRQLSAISTGQFVGGSLVAKLGPTRSALEAL